MIKRGLIALAFLVALFSGVGMVSAYESHVVNVQAHVENALTVPTHINFGIDKYGSGDGTVFPQEWLTKMAQIAISGSFCGDNQNRVSHVEGKIYFEEKPGFLWLGDAMYILLSPSSTPPTDATAMIRMDPRGYPANIVPPASPVLAPLTPLALPGNPHFKLSKPGPLRISMWLGLDVPVFEGYHNSETDVKPKPSNLPAPTVIIYKGDPRWNPDGVDLGVDMKIQVTSIHNPGSVGLCSEEP